jgi:hypothetical protein
METHSARSYSAQLERQIWHPARECQTLFAWWNSQRGDNFVTTQSKWIGGPGDRQDGYRFYARVADLFSADRAAPPGTIPMWSWWSPSREDNRITADPAWASNEKNPKTGFPYAFPGYTKGEPDYRCYRLEGYVYDPDGPRPTGAVALYTYYSPERNDHHLTTDPYMSHEGYRLVRKEGYAFPASPRLAHDDLKTFDQGFLGTVRETGTGYKIAGAQLTFASGEGGITRQQTSGREGDYRIHLPRGRYVVTAKHPDYREYTTSPGYFVLLGGWNRSDIEMQSR